jgi:hypothetical protein
MLEEDTSRGDKPKNDPMSQKKAKALEGKLIHLRGNLMDALVSLEANQCKIMDFHMHMNRLVRDVQQDLN